MERDSDDKMRVTAAEAELSQWHNILVTHGMSMLSRRWTVVVHRRNNRRGGGRLVPQLFCWGTNNVLVPNFLAVVFKKARNFTASSHPNAGFSI